MVGWVKGFYQFFLLFLTIWTKGGWPKEEISCQNVSGFDLKQLLVPRILAKVSERRVVKSWNMLGVLWCQRSEICDSLRNQIFCAMEFLADFTLDFILCLESTYFGKKNQGCNFDPIFGNYSQIGFLYHRGVLKKCRNPVWEKWFTGFLTCNSKRQVWEIWDYFPRA